MFAMDDTQTPEFRDRTIGENVARVRAAANKSQSDVADEMRAKGFKWSQATVWAVEKGERPLRLAEAEALAVVLDSSQVSDFLSAPLTYLYFAREVELENLDEAFLRVARHWADAVVKLAVVADEVLDSQGEAELGILMSANLTDDPRHFFATQVDEMMTRVGKEIRDMLREYAEVYLSATEQGSIPARLEPGPMRLALLEQNGERQEAS